MNGIGIVHLIGAGPGDPGLVTRLGEDLIRGADVIAYDELVHPAILMLARPGAFFAAVGRRAFAGGKVPYRVHPEVIAHARAGRVVARVKSGDPNVFGRAGEEAAELAAQGIPFTIVPGISAAFGAAAYTGIPLTDRGVCSDVTLATGHDLNGEAPSHTDWGALAKNTGTLVLYMAAKQLAANAQRLIELGKAATTPAAYVASATRPNQRVIEGTLETIAAVTAGVSVREPAILIVGEAVRLRRTNAWWEKLPLHGRTIAVARARPGPSRLAGLLSAQGATVLELPGIAIAPLVGGALDALITAGPRTPALAFACDASVAAYFRRAGDLGADIREVLPRAVFAVGHHAGAALRAHGIQPLATAPGACAEGIRALAAAGALTEPVPVCTHDGGRPALAAALGTMGITTAMVPTYQRMLLWPPHLETPCDGLAAPGSSAARLVLEGPFGARFQELPVFAIGPQTAGAAKAVGAKTVAMAPTDTLEALADHIAEFFRGAAGGG